jgi:hypothetical protein
MRTLPTIALVALVCLVSTTARAQDTDEAEVTRMAKEHYKAGLDAYKAGNYEVAIKELKRAYLLKRLPPLLLNIGATYRKMGDFDLALHFYKKYLDEAPAEAKDRGDVEKIVVEIEHEKASGGASKPAPAAKETSAPAPAAKEAPAPSEEAKEAEPPPAPRPAREFTHNVIDSAPPDRPIDVRVSMPVMKGVKVFVYYRQSGEADFTPVLMKRRGAEKVGRIPADAVQGKALQYYIEAKDPNGAVVKSSGSQADPNVVMIDPSAPPQVIASMEERTRSRDAESQEPSSDEESSRKRRRNMDDEAAPILATGETPHKQRDASGPGKFGPLFWAGIGVGVAGVAALVTGVTFGVLAKQQADIVSQDSRVPASDGGPLEFNPVMGDSDRPFEEKGQLYNNLSIGLLVAGGVLTAAGVTMIIVERVAKRGPSEKPKHRRPARDEEASRTPWYVAPSVGPRLTGLGAGFSF